MKVKTSKLDTLKLNFSSKSGEIKGYFNIITFEDGDFYISYIPSLNLSSYGDSATEAIKRISTDVLTNYLKNLLDAGRAKTLAELKKLGWHKSSYFNSQYDKSSYVDPHGVLQNFNISRTTKIIETATVV